MSSEVDFESETTDSPAAAAAALRALADQIESGSLTAGDGALPLPAEFKLKIELEEIHQDDGVQHEIEVEINWPISWKKTVTLSAEPEAS
ncbi:MAG: amphi-Trp domain-containing protein [Leptospirales bacterium]|jgi:amphi-Trp domain-containing protein